jgi:ABC-type multidrug transport system fused ATPase/permease subunit
MANASSLADIDKRIQIVEDNLRELIEQAAAYSGAADEERNAERIADQQAKLDALLKEREALLSKGKRQQCWTAGARLNAPPPPKPRNDMTRAARVQYGRRF